MGGINDYDEVKQMEEKIKAARREVRKIKAIKRVVDFFGNQIIDYEGKYMFLTDMYKAEFFTEEQTQAYQILTDPIDFEIVRRLFGE